MRGSKKVKELNGIIKTLHTELTKARKKIADLEWRLAELGKRADKSGWMKLAQQQVTPLPVRDVTLQEHAIWHLAKNAQLPPKARRWPEVLYSMAFIIYSTSSKAYRYLKRFLPMPAVSSLYEKFGTQIRFIKTMLTTDDGIVPLVEAWKRRNSIVGEKLWVDAFLGIDAAVCQPDGTSPIISGMQANNCFVWQVMPLNPTLTDLVCRVTPWVSGSLGRHSATQAGSISEILALNGIKITAIATDGDPSYDARHNELFAALQTRVE
jgi:hypothetical protein